MRRSEPRPCKLSEMNTRLENWLARAGARLEFNKRYFVVCVCVCISDHRYPYKFSDLPANRNTKATDPASENIQNERTTPTGRSDLESDNDNRKPYGSYACASTRAHVCVCACMLSTTNIRQRVGLFYALN